MSFRDSIQLPGRKMLAYIQSGGGRTIQSNLYLCTPIQ